MLTSTSRKSRYLKYMPWPVSRSTIAYPIATGFTHLLVPRMSTNPKQLHTLAKRAFMQPHQKTTEPKQQATKPENKHAKNTNAQILGLLGMNPMNTKTNQLANAGCLRKKKWKPQIDASGPKAHVAKLQLVSGTRLRQPVSGAARCGRGRPPASS